MLILDLSNLGATMEKEDQVKYLANVYHILLADGQVDPVETRVNDAIAREIGAGYFERKAAQQSAEGEQFEFQYLDRWSDRLRNLEDILFAAFCNGVTEPSEKTQIKTYLKPLRIKQEQLDLMISQAKQRHKEFKR